MTAVVHTVNAGEISFLANVCMDVTRADGKVGERTCHPIESLKITALRGTGPISTYFVNKAVEEKVLRTKVVSSRRIFEDSAVLYLAWSKTIHGIHLDKSRKRDVVEWLTYYRKATDAVAAGIEVKVFTFGPLMSLNPSPLLEEWVKVLDVYREVKNAYIDADPKIMGGDTVIRGTRIPVHAVAARIDGGDTLEDIQSDYPDVPEDAFIAALSFARANPRCGRPAKRRLR